MDGRERILLFCKCFNFSVLTTRGRVDLSEDLTRYVYSLRLTGWNRASLYERCNHSPLFISWFQFSCSPWFGPYGRSFGKYPGSWRTPWIRNPCDLWVLSDISNFPFSQTKEGNVCLLKAKRKAFLTTTHYTNHYPLLLTFWTLVERKNARMSSSFCVDGIYESWTWKSEVVAQTGAIYEGLIVDVDDCWLHGDGAAEKGRKVRKKKERLDSSPSFSWSIVSLS